MSDFPADYRERLDERTILEEIDRKRAETQRLQQETQKFVAEQRKLMAEAAKLERDRFFTPWLALVGLIGGIIGVLSALARWKGVGG